MVEPPPKPGGRAELHKESLRVGAWAFDMGLGFRV